ncbi:MAG: response regulator transcription factor [Nitrospira sp.]|nr:response regulator transcription factor [Nitrospira sp.]
MSLELVQIIEDEPHHARLLDQYLRRARYRTNVAGDGVTGLADVIRLNPSVVLLDLMLPGINGQEVCRRIRDTSATRHIPIMMISALGSEEERISGIEMGADDYLTKPFSPREVVSRVGSLLRRTKPARDPGFATEDHGISIEEHCFVITLSGHRLTVSKPEWHLLQFLSRRAGQIVSVEELASLIWTESQFLRYRELDVMIRSLKTKLENACFGSIEIVPTVGYRYRPLMSTPKFSGNIP